MIPNAKRDENSFNARVNRKLRTKLQLKYGKKYDEAEMVADAIIENIDMKKKYYDKNSPNREIGDSKDRPTHIVLSWEK